jgi:hypothetical protein
MRLNEYGNRASPVFVRQGHYAYDPEMLADYPAADASLDRIGELLNHEFSRLRAAIA